MKTYTTWDGITKQDTGHGWRITSGNSGLSWFAIEPILDSDGTTLDARYYQTPVEANSGSGAIGKAIKSGRL